jgi:hypothetical protein
MSFCIFLEEQREGKKARETTPVPHTVKKARDIPVPSRDVTNKTLPGRE